MRAGLVQLTVTDDPAVNLPVTLAAVARAAEGGADLILTPECTNILSSNRTHQRAVLHRQEDDPTLAACATQPRRLGDGSCWGPSVC